MSAFAEMSAAWKARRSGTSFREMSGLARMEARWGLIFLSPWLFGFLVFTLIPMAASLYFSFTKFNLIHPEDMQFVGLANYVELFQDPFVRKSAWITLRYTLLSVPVGVIMPIGMAALLNVKSLAGKRIFTTLFFLPSVIPLISGIYAWQGFLNPRTGWLNLVLTPILVPLGVTPPDWLNSMVWIYPALIMVGLWGYGNAMLTTLAGMQGVPTEYYEAARVDGAGPLYRFLHITLPMISPVIFYNLVLSVIGHFQYFVIAWIFGGPNSDPGQATLFYNVYLYKEAFDRLNMGYGATLAWALFAFALTVTVLLFSTAKYWVYYAGEEGEE